MTNNNNFPEYNYSRFAALATYIDRIKAEQRNFRRFVVKEVDERSGYYRVKATIKIIKNDDGSVEVRCDREEYAPTEEEAAAISAELAGKEFPTSMTVGKGMVDALRTSGLITGKLYSFLELSRKEVIFCQERADLENGSKAYYPWTMFIAKGSGPHWIRMEPDCELPFWKPPKKREKAHLMVHEGPKVAAYLDNLVNDPERKDQLKAHPWGEELARFEHWGTAGTMSLYRSDYGELRAAGILGDLIYVCDNDAPGVEVIPTFSRLWGKRLQTIRWGADYPAGFDLADPIPKKLINRRGFVSVRLLDKAEPATWVSKPIGDKKTTKRGASYDATEDFAREWVCVDQPEVYINRYFPRLMYSERQFDNHCAAFAHRGVKASELLKLCAHAKVETVNYDPGLNPGFYSRGEATFYNIYRRRLFDPYGLREVPDTAAFEDYLAKMFPVERDRLEVKRWLATLIARPGRKMNYGLLLVSETQGVGKTTLGNILAEILGPWNVSWPSERDITKSNFKEWVEYVLAVCNEIYAGHSSAAYNNLKEVITDKRLQVHKKYLSPYYIDNHLHVIACSNSMRALKLDNTDRRWLVPKVTEQKLPNSYWTEFYDWLYDDGFRKIKYWAETFLKTNDAVVAGAEAPWSAAKVEVIKESYSPGQQLIDKLLAWIAYVYVVGGEGVEFPDGRTPPPEMKRVVDMAKRGNHFIMFDEDGRMAIRKVVHHDKPNNGVDSLLTIRKVAITTGFFTGEERVCNGLWSKAVINARVISLSKELADTGLKELARAKVQVISLLDLGREMEPEKW